MNKNKLIKENEEKLKIYFTENKAEGVLKDDLPDRFDAWIADNIDDWSEEDIMEMI